MIRTLFVLVVVAAMAMAAPLPKATFKKLKDYYPLAKGHTWTYLLGESEIVVEVTECVVDQDGSKTAKLTTKVAGKDVATEHIRTGKDGIFRTQVNDSKVDPPVQILKFDKEDEEWEFKTMIGAAKIVCKVKHLGEEKIVVEAGTYTAIKLHIDSTISNTKTAVTYWLVEDVGIAQMEYKIADNDSPPLKLKSFQPGKE